MAKDFKKTAAQELINKATAEQKQTKAEAPQKPTPQATREDNMKYIPVEKRSRRVQIMLQPSLYKAVKKIADRRKVSFNDLLHNLLEEYAKNDK